MPLAVAILSTIAAAEGFEVRYFETSFYRKHSTAGEERMRYGEFKPVRLEEAIELTPQECMYRDFTEILSGFRPDILAVTANSLEYAIFCDLMNEMPASVPMPFTLVGGCHVTIAPEEVIRNTHVDAVCIGEGEEAWKEFLQKFKKREDLSEIRNLWLKDGTEIKKNPLRPLLSEDLLWADEIDFSFFDNRHFLKPFDGLIRRRCLVEVSRGCPYNCSYCVNSAFKETYRGLGKWFRIRPFASLQAGIRQMVRMGGDILQLQDECFFSIPLEFIDKFCIWYANEVRLPLILQTRPESVTEEKVKRIASMGVPVQITCGVESGSERILHDICNRHMTLDEIRRAFSIIRKYGLHSNAYTMIGFPTETRDEAFKTIHLIREIKPDLSIMSVFFPFQGVPLRRFCLEQGFMDGNEKARTFTDDSILRNQPMTPEEIGALRRTYGLYIRLTEEYFPKIELCEKDFVHHQDLFDELVRLSWQSR